MAIMLTTTTELAHQFQTKFNKDLLGRAIQLTVLDQFATKMPFPKNAGAKTMRFFRQESGLSSNVSTLTEGTLLATLSEVGLDYIEATLVQYGQRYNISDVMGMTELFSTLMGVKSRIAEEAALHADDIVRDEIAGSTITTDATPAGAFRRMYVGATQTFAGLSALTAAAGALTIEDVLRAATQLQINRAPKKNGEYFIVVAPQVAFDLFKDPKFLAVNEYQTRTDMVKGEVGKWWGVRVVVATNPFRETSGGTQGTFAAAGTIFTSFVVGADAFGTPIMAGQSEYNPSIKIIDTPDKYDALNQWTVVAWKAYWAAITLKDDWGIALKSKTTFV